MPTFASGAFGVAFGVAFGAFAAPLVLGGVPSAHAGELGDRFPADAVRRFELDLPAGEVTIRADARIGASVDEVSVDATALSWSPGCRLETGLDQGRAWAHVEADTTDADCQLVVSVALAPDTTVTVHLGRGNLRVVALAGALTADVGGGDVVLEDMTGALDAELGLGQLHGTFAGSRLRVALGSGSVDLRALRSPAVVELGTGDIHLAYDEAPHGTITAMTGAGSIVVALPAGTPVAPELSIAVGSERVLLPVTEGAPTRVDASTGLGRISVVPTDEAQLRR